MPGTGEKLIPATPILTMGVALVALFLGQSWWWTVLVLGWFVATPLVAVLFGGNEVDDAVSEAVEQRVADAVREDQSEDGHREERAVLDDREDALDVLRERYARGDLDEVTFERKVERLLATESLEEAEALVDGDDDRDPDLERA